MKRSFGVFVATIMMVALVMTAVAGSVVSGKDKEGCTPGYWKQPHHLIKWVGYTPETKFNSAFGVDRFDADATFLEVLKMKGHEDPGKLGAHAVAAVLNALTPGVSYPYSVSQVTNLLQTGDKAALEWANELGCPLGR